VFLNMLVSRQTRLSRLSSYF